MFASEICQPTQRESICRWGGGHREREEKEVGVTKIIPLIEKPHTASIGPQNITFAASDLQCGREEKKYCRQGGMDWIFSLSNGTNRGIQKLGRITRSLQSLICHTHYEAETVPRTESGLKVNKDDSPKLS